MGLAALDHALKSILASEKCVESGRQRQHLLELLVTVFQVCVYRQHRLVHNRSQCPLTARLIIVPCNSGFCLENKTRPELSVRLGNDMRQMLGSHFHESSLLPTATAARTNSPQGW